MAHAKRRKSNVGDWGWALEPAKAHLAEPTFSAPVDVASVHGWLPSGAAAASEADSRGEAVLAALVIAAVEHVMEAARRHSHVPMDGSAASLAVPVAVTAPACILVPRCCEHNVLGAMRRVQRELTPRRLRERAVAPRSQLGDGISPAAVRRAADASIARYCADFTSASSRVVVKYVADMGAAAAFLAAMHMLPGLMAARSPAAGVKTSGAAAAAPAGSSSSIVAAPAAVVLTSAALPVFIGIHALDMLPTPPLTAVPPLMRSASGVPPRFSAVSTATTTTTATSAPRTPAAAPSPLAPAAPSISLGGSAGSLSSASSSSAAATGSAVAAALDTVRLAAAARLLALASDAALFVEEACIRAAHEDACPTARPTAGAAAGAVKAGAVMVGVDGGGAATSDAAADGDCAIATAGAMRHTRAALPGWTHAPSPAAPPRPPPPPSWYCLPRVPVHVSLVGGRTAGLDAAAGATAGTALHAWHAVLTRFAAAWHEL